MTDSTAIEQPDEHHLYRHFSADGVLLYVGISFSAVHRLADHKDHSHWFRKIARVEIEPFGTRQEARAAERVAIKTEKPLHNIHHRKSMQDEIKQSQHHKAIDQSRDDLLSRVVSLEVCYPINKLPLPFPRQQIKRHMEEGVLGFIEFPNTTGTKMKRYVTGWQLLDYIEWLATQTDADRRFRKSKETAAQL